MPLFLCAQHHARRSEKQRCYPNNELRQNPFSHKGIRMAMDLIAMRPSLGFSGLGDNKYSVERSFKEAR
jgi:hypothetical protein